MAKEVKILRRFRDNFLLTNTLGKAFVKAYYKVSPTVAGFIAKNDKLRMLVRWSLLPLVGVSLLALKLGLVATLTVTVLLFALTSIGVTVLLRRKTLWRRMA